MHLILSGATGLVGSAALDAMIRDKNVTKISIISRRPVQMAEDARDPRINLILHRDFQNYDQRTLEQLEGASGCVWALGVSQTQVNKDEYVKITMDYALEAAKAFRGLASEERPFKFVYVSGQGATFKPGPFTSTFGRVKGETELILSALRKENPHLHTASVRPGFVDSSNHSSIKPYVPSRGIAKNAVLGTVIPIMKVTSKKSWSPTLPLGQFLTELALGQRDSELHGEGVEQLGDFVVIGNAAFRRLKGLDTK